MTKLKNVNWLLLVVMIALVAVGTASIASAGNARAEAVFHNMWIANLWTAVFGMVIYWVLAMVDYRQALSIAALPMYLIALVLLVAVLVFGSTVYGGRRWLWFFQPSELAKLAVIAFIADCFGRPLANGRNRGFWLFVGAALAIGVPALLILAEPDLGTTLTLIPATLLMLFVAKVWRSGLMVMGGIAMVAALMIFGAVYEAEKPDVTSERREQILKYLPLKPHQVKRVKVFLFPDEDQQGAGYNLRQAKISIGSGGMTGKGWGRGETNHLKYLPPSISMNDFIFCVYAEETGYVGVLVLLGLYALLLLPCCYVAYRAQDARGRLLSLGVSMLIFAHVFINIAMSIGLVPITGLPLPFISSGRTFLVVVISGLGMVQSVAIHRD